MDRRRLLQWRPINPPDGFRMRPSRTLARFEEHSLALFAALVLASGGAVAQTRTAGEMVQAGMQQAAPHAAPPGAYQRADAAFDRADADGDGRLSPQEAQRLPAVAERFAEIDTDRDRRISREEFHPGVGH